VSIHILDFTQRSGKGGESIYGSPFPDEDLSHPLDSEGLLAMANKGPNANGSQWFITLAPCPHLNGTFLIFCQIQSNAQSKNNIDVYCAPPLGKHVVFGKVIRGYQEVVQKIAAIPTDAKDRPSVPVVVTHCGELELRKPQPAAEVQPEKKVKGRSNPHEPEEIAGSSNGNAFDLFVDQ
jgi:cyclophilin family peptidyl-prolyl cis-trans isomerase